jgi:hypothetical protein
LTNVYFTTMSSARVSLVIAVLVTLVGLAGCKERKQEYNGIGQYLIRKTKLVDGKVAFRCQPSGDRLSWCFGGPDVKIGDQPAAVSLYFTGQNDDAPLSEIALAIRGCDAEKAQKALINALGPVSETKDKQLFWVKRAMFVSARLRMDGTTCDLSFVDPADQGRVDELRAGK